MSLLHAARRVLVPLAPLYGMAVAARNAAFERGLVSVSRVPVPVISIGNLTTGGTGKTPITRAIARELLAQGERPAILLRGYGAAGDPDPVPHWTASPPAGALARYGDEGLGHARALPGIRIHAQADRVASAWKALEAGCTVLILDDGFQHRRLHRDLDAVCLDAARPFGSGGLLPSGDLRERPRALQRADIVFWTRCQPGQGIDARARGFVRPGAEEVRWRFAAGRVRRSGSELGGAAPASASVLAFAGVGNVAAFARTASETGARVVSCRTFRDHHRYRGEEIATLEQERTRLGADALLTTEKDEVRILSCEAGRALAATGRLYVVELTVEPEGGLAERVARWLRAARGEASSRS